MDKSGISHIARVLLGEGSSGKPSLARGFRLGAWQVRPDLCTLEREGRSVPLEPKTMGVLLCLAQHAPQVVTREQFIAEVWNGRIVTDEVLSRAISLLRSQLEDDAHEPRFVRTIPRVGYALIAPVEAAEPPRSAIATEPGSRRWQRVAVALGLAVIAAFGWWWATRDAGDRAAGEVRLAVLPLAALGAAVDERYIADGLTEELTVNLSRVGGLRVVARNSALRFKSGDADLQDVAKALRATHVVSGSVRADDNRLRVTMHLSDSVSDTEVWAETYNRERGDLFAIQTEIASAVVQALRQRLPAIKVGEDSPATASAFAKPPSNPEAYRLFLQGRQQLARRGEEGTRAAIALLEQAITADRTFLRAHLALAGAYALLASVAPAEAGAALDRADRVLAEVARQTAMSGEVYAVRAWLEMERNHWSEAEDAFRAALAESPDDTELRLLYSQLLGATGQREAAWREAREALANDPLSPAANLRLAALSLWSDQNGNAAHYLATARDLGLAPSASPELPMLLLIRERRFDSLQKALAEVQRRRGQAEDWIPVVVAAISDPSRGWAADAALERAAAAGQLDRLLHLGALVVSHQNEEALRLLRSHATLRSRELEFIFSREAVELRRLAGFDQVVKQFGLDTYWDKVGWPAGCVRSAGTVRCS
ncbi:MAG TPA: winged helix-turn-helix domain-containing protein [Steroidobacteraceae bacterium]